jgi:hypothetical protein
MVRYEDETDRQKAEEMHTKHPPPLPPIHTSRNTHRRNNSVDGSTYFGGHGRRDKDVNFDADTKSDHTDGNIYENYLKKN